MLSKIGCNNFSVMWECALLIKYVLRFKCWIFNNMKMMVWMMLVFRAWEWKWELSLEIREHFHEHCKKMPKLEKSVGLSLLNEEHWAILPGYGNTYNERSWNDFTQ